MPLLKGAVHFPPCVSLCRILPLVVELFTTGEGDGHLHQRTLEVNVQRHNSQPLLLHLAEKAEDLAFVEQKPPGAQGILVKNIALFVGGDVHSVNEHLPLVDLAVALLQVQLAMADRLDLGAKELNAGLYFFFYEKLVIRAFVLRQNFYASAFCH